MKILLANTYPRTFLAGISVWAELLARELRQEGHACELFFVQAGQVAETLPEAMPARAGTLADLLEYVAAERYDIVHASVMDWDTGIAAARLLPGSPKLVLTHHGAAHPAWTSANCAALVGCSAWGAQDQQQWTDLPVRTIYNGIDTTQFTPPAQLASESPIVGWVGRGADPVKRLEKLAALAPILHRAGLRLWIADTQGPDKVAPDVAQVLRPLAEFWGVVSRERMVGFYQEIAASGGCLLCTSKHEGLPMALLEAQACGCPAVGPRVRGLTECIDPDYGGLLSPEESSPEEAGRLIIAMLKASQEMVGRREGARRFVCAKFSIGRMTQEYLRVYAEAPYPGRGGFSGLRARLRLAPQLRLDSYRTHRWTAGNAEFQAAQALAGKGQWELASAAVKTSLATCPTLYARPARLRSALQMLQKGN